MANNSFDKEVYYRGFFANFFEHIKQLFNFQGNEGRKAFWMFVLANILLSTIFFVVSGFLLVGSASQVAATESSSRAAEFTQSIFFLGLVGSTGILYFLFYIVQIFLSLSPVCRRIADAGFSRLWILLGFIPPLGLVLIIFLLMPTRKNYNKHVMKYNKEEILSYAEELKS